MKRFLTFCFWGLILLGPAGIGVAESDSGVFLTVQIITDGDTIVLADGRRVRYIGVNSPEIGYQGHPDQPGAQLARKGNLAMLKHKQVRLEFDRETRDRFGRWLAYVYLKDGRMINLEVLKAGYGYYLHSPANSRYHTQLLDAQRDAMEERRGIWKRLSQQPPGRGYLGNLRSRRFHLPDCPWGQQVAASHRIGFGNLEEAFKAGFAPGKKCLKAAP